MLQEANKALLKLWSMPVKLKFPDLGNPHKLQVVRCADGIYTILGDGSSQSTYIIFPRDDNGKIGSYQLAIKKKKKDSVTKSPLTLKTLALSEAAYAGFLISSLV